MGPSRTSPSANRFCIHIGGDAALPQARLHSRRLRTCGPGRTRKVLGLPRTPVFSPPFRRSPWWYKLRSAKTGRRVNPEFDIPQAPRADCAGSEDRHQRRSSRHPVRRRVQPMRLGGRLDPAARPPRALPIRRPAIRLRTPTAGGGGLRGRRVLDRGACGRRSLLGPVGCRAADLPPPAAPLAGVGWTVAPPSSPARRSLRADRRPATALVRSALDVPALGARLGRPVLTLRD